MTLFKTAFLAFFSILIFCSFTLEKKNSDRTIIEIYFSNKLDISDLSKIKLDLQEKGIKINYKSLKFSENGKLSQIDYWVSAGKFGGGDATENTEKEIGFLINTDPNAKYGIMVGSKESIQKSKEYLKNNNQTSNLEPI